MTQGAPADFSLLRYSAGDVLHFVFANGVRRRVSAEGAPPLPGLSMVVELQEKKVVHDKLHKCGTIDDPLYLEDLSHIGTHEQWCAHAQAACALAKNAVARCLQRRLEVRARRYGEAVVHLAQASPSLMDSEQMASATAADSLSMATAHSSSSHTSSRQEHPRSSVNAERSTEEEVSFPTSNEASEVEEEEEEDLETHLLQHPTLDGDMAAAWLRRRYLRCCDVISIGPSVAVRDRLSQCVRVTLSGTLGSSAARRTGSPLSRVPDAPATLLSTPGGQSWMSFPGIMLLLRKLCTVPYEVNADFTGCTEVGQHPRHFIALLGVLEGCRNIVVSLNFAKTCLSDDEVRVLCLFCHAYLRRLQILDLSGNKRITDKVAVCLKQLAASSPLLCRLVVRGTSLSRANVRTVGGILSRKAL
nr:unnamed protein product [Leishmania braziliensis]